LTNEEQFNRINHNFSFIYGELALKRTRRAERMARKKKAKNPQVEDYRHEDAKRKNIPPAGLVARGRTP
jgi:hypothetical protein